MPRYRPPQPHRVYLYRPRWFRSDGNFVIERALHEAETEIPFPQFDVHARSVSKREVRAEGD